MITVWPYWIVRTKVVFFTTEATLLAIIFFHVASGGQPTSILRSIGESFGLILVLISCELFFYFNRLDEMIIESKTALFITKLLKSLAGGLVLTGVLFFIFPALSPGFLEVLAAAVLSALMLFASRSILRVLVKRKKIVEGLLIVGTGDLAAKLYNELVHGKRENDIEAFITSPSSNGNKIADPSTTIPYSELKALTLRDGISRIVVAEPYAQRSEELTATLIDCKLRGLVIEEAVDSYERLNGKIWLEGLRPEWLIHSDGFRPSKFYLQVKRFMDITCAILLIILTAPLLALIPIAIKFDSPGPVLFKQERVGRYGNKFFVYKFRSMRQDAEQKTGPVWAGERDPRVTPLGRLLRKFRFDELPQAFNVLRGDMSFVGPRPERECFIKTLKQKIPYYDLRHYVKPGITGWAQVMYPYGASVEDSHEKMQYDLYYAKHMSLRMDLTILLKTTEVVLFGQGR